MISVIFPAYNEGQNVGRLHAAIKRVMDSLGERYEIIAVDDGSRDNTLAELKKLSPIRIVALARNSGQTAALDAGFGVARGETVVTLDADLQNDPADIPRLVVKLKEGYDVVSGWRKNRRDSWHRRLLSRAANRLTWWVTGLYLHDHACALKVYRGSVLKNIHLYGEMHVFLPAYLYGRGAKVVEMEVSHHPRASGLSKHNFMKAVKVISDLLTIKFIYSASRPLLFFGAAAAVLWLLAFGSTTVAIVLKIIGYANFGQTPLPLLAVLFLVSGLVLFAMGFLAEFLLRVYYESKGARPYIIKETVEN